MFLKRISPQIVLQLRCYNGDCDWIPEIGFHQVIIELEIAFLCIRLGKIRIKDFSEFLEILLRQLFNPYINYFHGYPPFLFHLSLNFAGSANEFRRKVIIYWVRKVSIAFE